MPSTTTILPKIRFAASRLYPREREPAAQQIARRRTARDGEVENSKNAAAFIFRKEVSDKRGRNGYKRCLANAYQSVTQQQLSVGVGDRRHQSQPAPEHSP